MNDDPVALRTRRQPVLVIGAGRGGSALLELFAQDDFVEVIAIADSNADAPGMSMARKRGIAAFTDVGEALRESAKYADCIVYNLTHDEGVSEEAARIVGVKNVTGGAEAKIFWQMVTELRTARSELEKSQEQLQAVIYNAMDGIIVIDDCGQIHGFNPAAEKIFGYTQQEAGSRSVNMLMPEPDRSNHDGYLRRYLETGEGRIIGVRGREVTAMRKDGHEFPLELSVSKMLLGGQTYFIGIVRDITDRKEAESKIRYLAHHDFLTGLPNRALFMDRLNHALLRARRAGTKEALLFLDLDGFKGVNDTLGHEIGDQLLQQAAKRISALVRASDTVARLGGDEFAVLLDNVHDAVAGSAVATKIIRVLSEPFELKGQRCSIGCSIGIAVYPDDHADAGTLLKCADIAMYRSKERGKNTYTFYSSVALRSARDDIPGRPQ